MHSIFYQQLNNTEMISWISNLILLECYKSKGSTTVVCSLQRAGSVSSCVTVFVSHCVKIRNQPTPWSCIYSSLYLFECVLQLPGKHRNKDRNTAANNNNTYSQSKLPSWTWDGCAEFAPPGEEAGQAASLSRPQGRMRAC